uniref:Candidate secreted effector n=1 Tax=Meloidogyne incognita TaxID=6306 RepID=A0A914LLK7_MELIC
MFTFYMSVNENMIWPRPVALSSSSYNSTLKLFRHCWYLWPWLTRSRSSQSSKRSSGTTSSSSSTCRRAYCIWGDFSSYWCLFLLARNKLLRNAKTL